MEKIHIVIIIVSVLIIVAVGGFLISKSLEYENDDWLDFSGDEVIDENICNDVLESHSSSEYIEFVLKREIMNVDENDNFYPDDSVSLIEFLEILAKVNFPRMDFEEVSGEGFVSLFVENGVIKEDEVGEEMFDSKVTNYQAVVLLAKCDMKIRNYEQMIGAINYKDLSGVSEVGQTLIGHCIARGFLSDGGSGYFEPDVEISRAEVAEIVYWYMGM